MIWWIALVAVLAVLAFLKVGAFVRYDETGASVKLVVGPLTIKLRSNEQKGQKAQKKKGRAGSQGTQKRRSSKGKLWIKAVLQNWSEIFQLIGRILSSPVLDSLSVKISVGGDDPAACAITYGRVCAAVSTLLPVVEATFSVKKQQIDISYDFEDTKMRMEAEASATLRVYELLALGVSALKLISNMYSFVKSNNESGADL